jgi:2-polyprenyl-6-methoxyphenol hydroxylase-like FAD-dependent oxidoreductase
MCIRCHHFEVRSRASRADHWIDAKFIGQGGNHAIQDAHNLVEAVKKIAASNDESARQQLQTELIRTYSDEVAKRGAEETNLSTKNGRMYVDSNTTPLILLQLRHTPLLERSVASGLRR